MIFDLSSLHLGDVIMALPAMRSGDGVVARPAHRIPGAPVAWLDAGQGTVRPRRGLIHETVEWLRASGREPVRHELLSCPAPESIVLAPSVRVGRKAWPVGRWLALRAAMPDARLICGASPRLDWMHEISRAHTVVCPDTGTAHMADALGVPRVVVLHGMGRAHFERYHPYWTRGENCIVRDTMEEITVDDVLEVVHG